MAKATKFGVQHFIACPTILVVRAAPDNPYTLRDVSYHFDIPADQEWPVRLDDLWLYVRFFNGRGVRNYAIDVTWLDAPNQQRTVCTFDPIAVRFPRADSVHSRAWRVAAVRYPGPGRYRFRLRRSGRRRVLAEEFIDIRRLSNAPQA
jgi:hypothetical protein